MSTCATGKRVFFTHNDAEEALLDAWIRNHYNSGSGPIAVYQCTDCNYWHWTSKGTINSRLSADLASGKINKLRDGHDWERKLR
jgi:hypothetical protein